MSGRDELPARPLDTLRGEAAISPEPDTRGRASLPMIVSTVSGITNHLHALFIQESDGLAGVLQELAEIHRAAG